jgi:hypothetical protein
MSIGEGFLAGFVEGEASLRIHEQNGGQSFGCLMALNQRDDEQETMEHLLVSTGLGRLRRVAPRLTSKPQIAWIVDSQVDCRSLLALLEPCGFHGRRTAELDIWRRGVRAWTETNGAKRRSTLRELKHDLAAARRFGAGAPSARPFASREQLLGYIRGFASAEGCFGLSSGRPVFSVHLRADDRALLELLAAATGLGRVNLHRPVALLNPSATWTIAARAELSQFIDLLGRGGLSGRKLKELEVWGEAVAELNRVAPRREMLEAARERLADVRAYRPPHQAGLRDRLARAPRPVGGEAGRAARRAQQRTRVIAAVHLYEREHGRVPRAMEFFRWRYEGGIDAPTQGTVYRLFPAGWAEVVAVARALPAAA